MEDREKLLKEIFETAVENEMVYFGCSQAPLGALQEKFDEVSADVFKAGSAFAGGVARQGQTCGALVGAIMAICAVVGRERLEDLEQYQIAMGQALRVVDIFVENVGDTLCSEIQKARLGRAFQLRIPEEREAFEKAGGHERKGCPEVCGIAARAAAQVILDIKDNGDG